jgi:MFS family permease
VDNTTVSRHTGVLTALYSLSLFLFAPLWGRLSDRRGPRGVLLVGLLGFGAIMLAFSFVDSLAAVYIERFLSGLFAAAVAPVAAAAVGSLATSEQGRARQLTFLGMASIAGFLLGPMLGVFVARFGAGFLTRTPAAGSVAIPLAATALLAFLVTGAVAIAVPGGESLSRLQKTTGALDDRTRWLETRLLVLTFIVSAGVGVFEVGLALRGKLQLGLTEYQIALMFTECSVVMLIMQALVFSPWFQPAVTRWLIAPGLLVLTAGLFLIPWASTFTLMLVAIGAVAASAGILSPILTYWISAKAANAQGWELGKQTATASLGVTVGSMAGGFLFTVTFLPGASFFLTAGLTLVGVLLSLRLPHFLAVSPCEPQVPNVAAQHAIDD